MRDSIRRSIVPPYLLRTRARDPQLDAPDFLDTRADGEAPGHLFNFNTDKRWLIRLYDH